MWAADSRGAGVFGTLASAMLLPFTGKLLDRVALRPFALAVCALMGFACATAAFTPSAGVLVLAVSDHRFAVVPYLALLGLSSGTVNVAGAALWAELYGTLHLGAIRSVAAAASVLASAIGPVSMGVMMDRGLSDTAICMVFVGLIDAATASVSTGLVRHRATLASSNQVGGAGRP